MVWCLPKARLIFVIVGLIFGGFGWAQTSGDKEQDFKPEYLLQRIDTYKAPVYTGSKDDLDYKKDFVAGYLRYLEKKNVLIWDFVSRYPEHDRSRVLMEEWFQNLGGGTVPCTTLRIPKAQLEIDTLLFKKPKEWIVAMAQFYKAYFNLCLPWNQLRAYDAIQVPSDDRQRRQVIQVGMNIITEFTKSYPDDLRGTKLYDILAQAGRDPVSARAIYSKLIASYPDHPSMPFFKGKLHRYDKVTEDFEMEFEDAKTGNTVTTKDYEGKVLLIVFWASNLDLCQRNMTEAKRLWFRYQPKGLEIVDVALDMFDNGDGKKRYLDYIETNHLDWKHYFQGGGWESKFSQSWGVNAFPTMFLVDRHGKLAMVDAQDDTEAKIKSLLAGSYSQ